jgi:hypothetical protein
MNALTAGTLLLLVTVGTGGCYYYVMPPPQPPPPPASVQVAPAAPAPPHEYVGPTDPQRAPQGVVVPAPPPVLVPR